MFNTAYGDNALRNMSIFKWIKRLNEVHKDCKDNERPEYPSNHS